MFLFLKFSDVQRLLRALTQTLKRKDRFDFKTI